MKKRILSLALIIAVLFALTACKPAEAYVATVNGDKVSTALYKYVLESLKSSEGSIHNPGGDPTFWQTGTIDNKPAAEYIKDLALKESAKQLILKQKAKESGYKQSAAEKQDIEDEITNYSSQYGSQQEFLDALAQINLTPNLIRTILQINQAASAYYEKTSSTYTSDQVLEYYNSNAVCVKHILIKTVDDTQTPLPAEQQAAARTKAEDLLRRIKAGEDFDALMTEFSEDPGSAENPDGYVFGKYGNMVEPFLSVSLSLQVGEVSEIVETSYGFHIIKRYEHVGNETLLTSNSDSLKGEIFTAALDTFAEEAKIEINHEEYDVIIP